MAPGVAVVLIASPLPQLDREFEYRIPERLTGQVDVGMRVRVPVRSARRTLDGFVLRVTETPTFQGTLAEIDELVSAAPVVPPQIARLARAVADRQAGVAADVIRLALPQRRARVETAWLAARADGAPGDDPNAARAEDFVRLVADRIGDEAGRALTGDPGARIALRAPVGVGDDGIPHALALLADVAAAHVCAGRGAVLVVPDYRDVELAHRALVDRLGPTLVRRADAATKPTERYRDHLACLDGPSAVVGTRSAAYAPLDPLGVVLMWDDADESYAEPLAPYPHTREVLLERQRQSGCTLVLAAHAPSLETARLVRLGWVTAVSARIRPPRVLPSDAVIGQERLAQHARIPSVAWRTVTEALEHGPVLVQVARAGYVPATACAACREPARCVSCGGPLRLHERSGVPRCGVCGAASPAWACPACGGTRLRIAAVGVSRTAEELGRAFPGVPVVIADGDARRISVDATPALVIATRGAEPVPIGGYHAVLLLDGERLLAREALDAGIDTLRWWSNAAALAAPSAPVVLVGGTEGPARALTTWRQDAEAEAELDVRRRLEFPPAVRVATVRGTRDEIATAVATLDGIAGLRIDGPVPDTPDASPDGQASPDARGASSTLVTTLRFPFAAGTEVAARLKAAIVRAATTRRPARAGRPGARASTLRVRLDEPGRF